MSVLHKCIISLHNAWVFCWRNERVLDQIVYLIIIKIQIWKIYTNRKAFIPLSSHRTFFAFGIIKNKFWPLLFPQLIPFSIRCNRSSLVYKGPEERFMNISSYVPVMLLYLCYLKAVKTHSLSLSPCQKREDKICAWFSRIR